MSFSFQSFSKMASSIAAAHSLLLSPPSLSSSTNPNPSPTFFSSRPPPSSRHLHNCRRGRNLPPPLRVATPPTAPAPTSETLENEEESASSSGSDSDPDSFSWRDHWYPVSLIEDLDTRRPTPFQLLNRDIVLWKDPKGGDWVAFDDRCPHRLAPLSVNLFSFFYL